MITRKMQDLSGFRGPNVRESTQSRHSNWQNEGLFLAEQRRMAIG